MSIFLMGCYDPKSEKWCTVTKCSGGHDDATLARLQTELDMVKISKVRGGARDAQPRPELPLRCCFPAGCKCLVRNESDLHHISH